MESARNVLKRLIVEQLLSEAEPATGDTTDPDVKNGMGAVFDDLEVAAKERYEAAKARLDAWLKVKHEFDSWKAAGSKRGNSPKFPAGTSQTSQQKLENELRSATEDYAQFDPSFADYDVKRDEKTPKGKAELPPGDKKALVDISNITPLTWNKWPSQVLKSGRPFGSSATKDADAASGVGPGEEWLALMLGAQVQGGSVSYDVVTKDGRKWEVKALQKNSETIRPGTEGLRAFEKPRKRLNSLLTQVKNFSIIAKKPGFLSADDMTTEERRIVDFVTVFIESEFENIVSKGEIPRERMIAVRGVIKALKKFMTLNDAEAGDDVHMPTVIGLNDKKVNVDKPTFIDVAKRVKRVTGDERILADFEKKDILLSTLKDPAFSDPKGFFDAWYTSININTVFEQVDGVFIVNPGAYMLIPRSDLGAALKFVKVSQGKPRFALVAGQPAAGKD